MSLFDRILLNSVNLNQHQLEKNIIFFSLQILSFNVFFIF